MRTPPCRPFIPDGWTPHQALPEPYIICQLSVLNQKYLDKHHISQTMPNE